MASGSSISRVSLLLCCYFLIASCKNELKTVPSTFTYIRPQYQLTSLYPTTDTICLKLNEKIDSNIQKTNFFCEDGQSFLSFYDRSSESVSIFNFQTQQLIKKIFLKNLLKGKKMSSAAVYTKSFDSIFVANQLALYLFDSSGAMKFSIDLQTKPYAVRASLDNAAPPVIKGDFIYTKAVCYLGTTTLEALRKWKSIYRIDIDSHESNLYYELPKPYQTTIYSTEFFEYNYCYNDAGNFVFSFPADTSIYETNLADYHIAYYAKSETQKTDILPFSSNDLSEKNKNKSYLLRDSYGAILFDPYKKRYLRIINGKLSEKDYLEKNWKKKQRAIIFNKDFEIIGESPVESDVLLKTAFFTPGGDIFARVRSNDRYCLYFVRLKYEDNVNRTAKIPSTELRTTK